MPKDSARVARTTIADAATAFLERQECTREISTLTPARRVDAPRDATMHDEASAFDRCVAKRPISRHHRAAFGLHPARAALSLGEYPDATVASQFHELGSVPLGSYQAGASVCVHDSSQRLGMDIDDLRRIKDSADEVVSKLLSRLSSTARLGDEGRFAGDLGRSRPPQFSALVPSELPYVYATFRCASCMNRCMKRKSTTSTIQSQ